MKNESIPSSSAFFELLQMRYEFEELVRHFKNIPYASDYATAQRFIDTGYKRNRSRPGADKALALAKTLVAEAEQVFASRRSDDAGRDPA